MADKVKNPLDDYQLIEKADKSLFIANADDFGVEATKTLENTAKPYIENKETGEPGVVTGEPLNAIPRGDLDKDTYDNTSDVYFNPEYTFEVAIPEEEAEDDEPADDEPAEDPEP